jgi:hypothetical protein
MGVLNYPLYQCKSPSRGAVESNNQVYPGPTNSWTTWNSGSGEYTIQGTKWKNDARLQTSGDPTSSSWASIKLNTGANHDCNAFWGCSPSTGTERFVRGVYFRHHTNGSKFRPRITGVALRYSNPNTNASWYYGLTYRGTNYTYAKEGTLPYEGTNTSNWWYGVGARNKTDSPYFHDKGLVWTGVLFHYETTWKSGSANDTIVYLKNLRPIVDASDATAPTYNDKYRVWGVQFR